MPSMLISHHKNFKVFMLKGTLTATLIVAKPSGCSNEDLVLEIMKHFVKHKRSNRKN